MTTFRILARISQYEHWFVEADSVEAIHAGVFQVNDTETLEGDGDEIIEVEEWPRG
jgi:hypothetical protein